LDAAIIDIALVILAVFSTLWILRRICLTLGIFQVPDYGRMIMPD